MCRHHAAKNFRRFAVVQYRLQLGSGIGIVLCQSTRQQHFHTQGHRHFKQPRVTIFARQEAHGFAHLYRITGTGCQHLVHVGQQRRSFTPCTIRDTNDSLRQIFR